jgi:hypothetical protein
LYKRCAKFTGADLKAGALDQKSAELSLAVLAWKPIREKEDHDGNGASDEVTQFDAG